MRLHDHRTDSVRCDLELGGARTILPSQCSRRTKLSVPSTFYRQEVRPFTDKQIELITELRSSGRYRHRERAAAQRTAPAYQRPHRAHSRPHGGARAADGHVRGSSGYQQLSRRSSASVCDHAGESRRICDAEFGNIYRWDGERLTPRCDTQYTACFCRGAPAFTFQRPNPKNSLGRMLRAKAVVHVADATAEPGMATRAIQRPSLRSNSEAYGPLAVPMLKENELIGVFHLYRQEVRPFTDKQIALVRTLPPKRSSPSRTRAYSRNCARELTKWKRSRKSWSTSTNNSNNVSPTK